MDIETVTLFFALLAGLAMVIAAAVVVSAVSGDRLGVVAALRPVAIELAAAVAVTATLGSLYLSEVQGFDPCRLCWVQRGFMYPAALLLVAALITKHRAPLLAAGVLAVIGLPIAVFHRYEQAAGSSGSFCDAANPCSQVWVERFGFVTIPTMAAAGFIAVFTLVAVAVTGRSVTVESATADRTHTENHPT